MEKISHPPSPNILDMDEMSKRAGILTVHRSVPLFIENTAFISAFNASQLARVQEAPTAINSTDAVPGTHSEETPYQNNSARFRFTRRVVAAAAAISLFTSAADSEQASAQTPQEPLSAEFSVQSTESNQLPIGFVDGSYTAWQNVVIDGWVADPDRPGESLEVHIYRDGQFLSHWGAVESSPDVTAAAPQFTGNHRFHIVMPQAETDQIDHEFCVYAINKNSDSHPLLGCTITGNPDPTNIHRLAADQSWLYMSDAERSARIEREFVQINRAMKFTFADNGPLAQAIMPEIAWLESTFGTHLDANNGRSGYVGILQIDPHGDLMLVNPYYSILVADSILERQGLNAWPNTSRMALQGFRSSRIFKSGNPALTIKSL